MLACKVRETRGRIGLLGEAHLFSFPGMAGLPSGIWASGSLWHLL
jgi:hypothetical protein